MSDFKDYRKKNVQPMRPYILGEDLSAVSVSPEDVPEEGGMIAINPITRKINGMQQSYSFLKIMKFVKEISNGK